MRRVLSVSVLCALGSIANIAQQPSAPLRFEVASIKVQAGARGAQPPSSLVRFLRSTSLRNLIREADDLAAFRVLGGPEWVGTEEFAVNARSASPTGAQSAEPTFEVASVKKVDKQVPPAIVPPPSMRGGTLTLQNLTVKSLVQYAYSLRDFQVVGGPDWVTKDLFEITARAAGTPSTDAMMRMLQTLLADRFGLRTHTEQREMRFLAMMLASADRRPGPYFHRMPDTGPCVPDLDTLDKGRQRLSLTARSGLNCATLSRWAETVSRILETPVLDRTGLAGRWSANVYYAPDRNVGPFAGRLANAAPPNPNAPSFTAALQEQLGLKLESTRAPLEVRVIDSVERPTPD